jgi:hypothetical protein
LVTDGSRIYFVIRDVPDWNLMQTSVEGGSSQETSTPFDNTRIIDLSPDHSQFLIGHRTKVKRRLVELRGHRCIFTGLVPNGSVYVTVDDGGVDVYSVDLQLP